MSILRRTGVKKIFGFVVIIFFMSWGLAFGDYSITFVSNDNSLNASATLITASNGPGPLTVTGGSITGTFGYATLYPGASGTGYTYSPAGVFIYDNQLSPGSSQPLTLYGLLFTTGTYGNADYKEINLWANSTAINDYSYVQWTQGTGYSDYTTPGLRGTSRVTPASSTVPVPGAILLFAPGLAGIALLRKRNKE
jgi:hypothetical protein